MRFMMALVVLAASFAAAPPQYRTHNDRMEPPRFTSAEAWAARAQYLREHVLASAGLMPMPERAPLHPVIFDEVTHADYTVSKVYFESLPGFFVTGNLYRPIGAGPFPAILSPHGHWTYGRLENTALNSGPGRAIAHTFGGRRESLWGLSLGGLQLWNGIRALDFLETLPYVRRDGFGVTGESGGGTQTFLLGAVDNRVAVAAPVNMISLHMQGGCLCENMPGLRLDTNNVEIAGTIAPRPLLMVSATGDWTADTLEVEYPAMRSLYALLGAESRVRAVRFTAEHNYNKDSREAMYAWMARWLQHAPEDVKRPERSFSLDKITDLLVFYGRPLPDGAVTAGELTDRWIASAKAQLTTSDLQVKTAALRHALGFGVEPVSLDAARGRPAASVKSARRTAVIAGAQPEVESLLRKSGFDVRPVTFKPFDAPAAGRIQHFDTYNRTAASQRVADIVAALRESPSAVLVASADVGPAALLAAAIAPVRRAVVDVGGFDTSSDAQFLDRVYIPGLRRAGDFQTAAAMMRGEMIVHNAGDAFRVTGIRVERQPLTVRQIAALAVK